MRTHHSRELSACSSARRSASPPRATGLEFSALRRSDHESRTWIVGRGKSDNLVQPGICSNYNAMTGLSDSMSVWCCTSTNGRSRSFHEFDNPHEAGRQNTFDKAVVRELTSFAYRTGLNRPRAVPRPTSLSIKRDRIRSRVRAGEHGCRCDFHTCGV